MMGAALSAGLFAVWAGLLFVAICQIAKGRNRYLSDRSPYHTTSGQPLQPKTVHSDTVSLNTFPNLLRILQVPERATYRAPPAESHENEGPPIFSNYNRSPLILPNILQSPVIVIPPHLAALYSTIASLTSYITIAVCRLHLTFAVCTLYIAIAVCKLQIAFASFTLHSIFAVFTL